MRNIDYDYVAVRNADHDNFWEDHEKWYYYDRDNQNYIMPTILLSIIFLFTGGLAEGVIGIIVLVLLVRFKCYLNNCALDNDLETLKAREDLKQLHFKLVEKGL